jgi:Flp pilus assembly pilin Flp
MRRAIAPDHLDRKQRGASFVEYVLLLAGVLAVVVGGLAVMSATITDLVNSVADAIAAS